MLMNVMGPEKFLHRLPVRPAAGAQGSPFIFWNGFLKTAPIRFVLTDLAQIYKTLREACPEPNPFGPRAIFVLFFDSIWHQWVFFAKTQPSFGKKIAWQPQTAFRRKTAHSQARTS